MLHFSPRWLYIVLGLTIVACSDAPSEALQPENDAVFTFGISQPPAQPIATVDISPPISPLEPTPSAAQLDWQRGEMYMFVHFGMNTFSGVERGTGRENPAWFNPTGLDVRQWVAVAKEAGFAGIIFTAKHHDGFALWPTAYSDFSVKNSPWKQGAGDLVREVANACREAELKFGIYLSPLDKHEPTYGLPAYNDFYVNQLTELLTNYGPIFEVWLDGAGDPSLRQAYDLPRFRQAIKQIQPDALVAILGRDIRWVGNEKGIGPETQWSVNNEGWWYPAECDVPNRPSWFWNSSEDDHVKTLGEHLEIYFGSVGRNCVLLLNVPPNRDGLFAELDVERLRAFRSALDAIFDENLAQYARVKASDVRGDTTSWTGQNALDGKEDTFWTTNEGVTQAWLEIDLGDPKVINTAALQEAIQYGQRVESYRLEAWHSNQWRIIARGTTIGYKKLDRTVTVKTRHIRLVIESAKASPAIQHLGLYYSPY